MNWFDRPDWGCTGVSDVDIHHLAWKPGIIFHMEHKKSEEDLEASRNQMAKWQRCADTHPRDWYTFGIGTPDSNTGYIEFVKWGLLIPGMKPRIFEFKQHNRFPGNLCRIIELFDKHPLKDF